MVQQIITYIIIATALLYSTYKLVKTFTGKRKKDIVTSADHTNCDSCSAECIMRDSILINKKNGKTKREELLQL